MKNKTLGEKISPVLKEIHDTLWEHEARSGINNIKPNYTEDGFRSAVKIFTSAMMDKMYDYQEEKQIKMEDRMILVEQLGKHIHELVKESTGIDMHEYYEK